MTEEGSSMPPGAIKTMVLGGLIGMLSISAPLVAVAPQLFEISVPVFATEILK